MAEESSKIPSGYVAPDPRSFIMMMPVPPDSTEGFEIPEGYEVADYQQFGGRGEGGRFIQNFCRTCNSLDICEDTKTLRSALGDNYPMWSNNFLKIEVDIFHSSYDTFAENKEETLCKNYDRNEEAVKKRLSDIKSAQAELDRILAEPVPLEFNMETMKFERRPSDERQEAEHSWIPDPSPLIC